MHLREISVNLHAPEPFYTRTLSLLSQSVRFGLNSALRLYFVIWRLQRLTTFPTQQRALQHLHSWITRLRKHPHSQASHN